MTSEFISVERCLDIINGMPFRFFSAQDDIKNVLLPIGHKKLWIDDINLALAPGSVSDELRFVPRLSTLALGVLISEIVATIPESHSYLNIGTWHGFTLFCCSLRDFACQAIGVDNFSELNAPRKAFYRRLQSFQKRAPFEFYEQDFYDFLAREDLSRILGPVSFYFYDGAHDYQSQFDALVNIQSLLAQNCMILVDDTNLRAPRQATLDFLQQNPDFHLIADLKTQNDRHPTWWNGLMLLYRA